MADFDNLDKGDGKWKEKRTLGQIIGGHISFCKGAKRYHDLADWEAVKARLEIDPRHSYDGIDCRDEEIKQLEERISGLMSSASKVAVSAMERMGRDHVESGTGTDTLEET